MENDDKVLLTSKPSVQTKIQIIPVNRDAGEKRTLIKTKSDPNKRVMPIMDVLLTLFIVTPLIVGFWRGTWVLMDVYAMSFPPWESFVFGNTLHLSFTVMRHGLQDLIQIKNGTLLKNLYVYSLRRLYTYLFAAACILHWRGGWIINDDLLGIQLTPDGRALPGKHLSLTVVLVFGLVVLLVLLRSVRNSMAAPFVIALDTKNSAFDFPTRYRKPILYTTLYAVNTKVPIENFNKTGNASEAIAEKLTGHPITIEQQVIEHISPRPFINDLRGAPPSGFSPSMGVPTPANYNPFPNHNPSTTQPNNIQDIIQYLSANAHREKELIREEQATSSSDMEKDKFKVYGMIQNSNEIYYNRHHLQQQQPPNAHAGFNKDPFFAFKPQDPGEINLMAPNNFRFAPSIVSSGFYKNRNKRIQEAATSAVNMSHDGIKKPLSLMFNIYPSPFEIEYNRHRIQQPPRLGLPNFRNPVKPGGMIVHLNLYPGGGINNMHPHVFNYMNENRY